MKKTLITLLTATVLLSCTGCSKSENGSEVSGVSSEITESAPESNTPVGGESTVTSGALLKTSAEEWTSIVEGKSFKNIDFSNAALILPDDIGEIYDLKITRSSEPVCSQAEFVERFAEYVKEIFPNSTYADDKNCYEFRGYNAGEKRFVHAEDGFNYARVYDNLPKLENGDITLESLLYQTDSHGVHETDEYFWYFLDGSSAKMNRGNCMRNVEKERQIAGWMPRDNYIAVSSYTLPDKSVFKLDDGEVSLDDAAKFCENYLSNTAPYSRNSEVDFKVNRADILELGESSAFVFYLTKTYNGIPFDSLNAEVNTMGFSNENGYNFDNSEVLMTKGNEIEYCYLSDLNCKIAETDKLTDVVSLKKAAEIVSDTMSEFVTFEVQNVSLVYCDKTRTGKKGEYENPSTASAHWLFEMFNPNDGYTYVTYVSLRDGNCFYSGYGSAL